MSEQCKQMSKQTSKYSSPAQPSILCFDRIVIFPNVGGELFAAGSGLDVLLNPWTSADLKLWNGETTHLHVKLQCVTGD